MQSDVIIHKTAGAFLLDSQNRIFLSKRIFADGTVAWVNAKGHVEEFETNEQAAIREVKEETGYQNIKIITILKNEVIEYEYEGRKHQKEINWFLAILENNHQIKKTLSSNEIDSFQEQKWFGLDEALLLLTFENDRTNIKNIIEYLLPVPQQNPSKDGINIV